MSLAEFIAVRGLSLPEQVFSHTSAQSKIILWIFLEAVSCNIPDLILKRVHHQRLLKRGRGS